MAYASVTLRPGVNVEATPTLNEAGISSSALGRFRAGLFEKIGGWVSYFPFTLGVPRCLKAWQDFNGVDRLAVGSTTQFNVITTGSAANITPQTLTSDFAPDFTTSLGSNVVTIDDPNIANVTTLDVIEFDTPISVGGIILSGVYPINLVTGTTSYRILAATNATAAVASGGAVPEFVTTAGSALVAVNFDDHGLAVGNTFVFPIATTVGSVTISGETTVVSVPTADQFTISAPTTASSSTSAFMNGGDAELVYTITIGPPSSTGTGWGINGYGDDPWGGTGAPPSQQTGAPIVAADWTIDNWGKTLLACPADQGIFQWTPGSGYQTMQRISAAPAHCSGCFVAAAQLQILIAYGVSVQKNVGVLQDPLAWAASDQLDYEFWTPNVVNPATGKQSQANSNRIPTGSRIVAGLATSQQNLLWTDLDLWLLNYVGPPLVWGQTKIGSNCGAMSRHAVAEMGGLVFWPGEENFFILSGGAPKPVPCPIWDVMYQDLDTNNMDKVWVETVTSFNEFWVFFPSASGGSGQCDTYIKWNTLENTWDYGSLPRSAGIDQSVLGNPIMATPNGQLYQHETGYNADGQPITYGFTTGYFMLGDGEDFVFVDQVIPDMKWGLFNGAQTASVQLTFNVVNNVGDTPRTYGPFTMTNTTSQLNGVRFRGRQASITLQGSDLNSFSRLGRIRYRFAQDGRR